MGRNKIIFGNEVLIDLTSDTVTPSDLAYGVTAHDNSGAQITGTSTYDADTSDATAGAAARWRTSTRFRWDTMTDPEPFR